MKKREFNHKSPLNKKFATGNNIQKDMVDSIGEQIKIIKKKKCKCKI